MSMKRVLTILLPLTVLSAMLFAACGGSSGDNGGGQSGNAINYSGTITIWHGWQGDYLTAKKAIFDEYQKLHPQVKIQLVQQENVVDKSITAIKAKNGPDIIAWVDDSLGKLASSRSVIPVDQYISADFVNSNYSKAAAQAVTFNGKIYGVPETVEAITLMYNKKLVKESDLPKTTDDLLNFAKTYQQQNAGKYGVIWPTEDAYYNAAWFYGFGAFYVKEDGTVGLNTPQAIAATKYIASFKPYMPKQISGDIAKSLFTEGKAAMVIDGPWSYSDYANKAGIDVGFLKLPTVTSSNNPATPFVGVKSLWITSNAKNPALAADLMKFYTNKENQIKMIKATSEIPANAAAASDSSVTSTQSIAGYAAQVQNGVPLPNTPYMSALWKPVADALTAVWTGSQTPEAAMKAAQDAADKGVKSIQS
ncbi:MAG: extracellular solute-binding protein [Ktedonobacteraceae bacterium]|nr:extracellular solute-binding protein [Ktedonobacteraceae bacterium]